MLLQSRRHTPNPHLGAYFGIVASTFISLAILLAMAEQLGWQVYAIARLMMLLPLILYLVIAVGARTLNVEDFFVAGRRVPQVYNAFLLALITVGGTGFFAYTGSLFFTGFDGLAIGLGWTCGLLLATVLFAPYLRRAGAYTLPAFLGQRFGSRRARLLASALQIVPTGLLLAAEVKIAATVFALFLPAPFWLAVLLVTLFIAAITILGGVRALTWSGCAQFIAGSLGLAIPLIVIAIVLTNLPAPQFTYGDMLSTLQNVETATGLAPIEPGAPSALPGAEPSAAMKPFLQTFGVITEAGFFALFFCFALGTAALPSLLSRSGVTASVSDERRSVAWALLLVALFAMTAPAIVVFVKALILGDVALIPTEGLPAWLSALGEFQLLRANDLDGDGTIAAGEILLGRDQLILTLPTLAATPFILTALIAAAGFGIALAAAGSHLFTLSASLADDLYRSLDPQPITLPRLMVVWAAIAVCAFLVLIYLLIVEIDALRYAVAAFAFAAATFFPVLLLSIWWQRCSDLGALTSLAVGFSVMALYVMLGGVFGFTDTVIGMASASLLAVLLALGAGFGVSLYGPAATMSDIDYFEAMRRPDGEALIDEVEARAATAAARRNLS